MLCAYNEAFQTCYVFDNHAKVFFTGACIDCTFEVQDIIPRVLVSSTVSFGLFGDSRQDGPHSLARPDQTPFYNRSKGYDGFRFRGRYRSLLGPRSMEHDSVQFQIQYCPSRCSVDRWRECVYVVCQYWKSKGRSGSGSQACRLFNK